MGIWQLRLRQAIGSATGNACAILFKQATTPAGMAELADAADSKSADRKVVGVRPPLPAPSKSVMKNSSLQPSQQISLNP